jgi:hypothetical protein
VTTEPLFEEMVDFARACRTGEAPVSDGEFGLDVVTVLAAVQASIDQAGRTIPIDWS